MGKKVVISGYYGFGNFGDEAILAVLVRQLKLRAVDITVFSSNPEKTKLDLDVHSVYSFNFLQIHKNIKNADVLISGGGSLLQDVTSLKSLIYYLGIIFLALFYKKDVIIFAQGIGPITNKIAQFFTAYLLKRCSFVSVRDYRSQNFLKQMGVDAKVYSDPVFSMDLPVANCRGIIGIQLREFATLTDFLLNKLARYIVKEFSDKKIELYSLQTSIDLEVCQKFKQILHEISPCLNVEIVDGLSIQNLLLRFSMLEYMIAMRFHALVVALKMGIRCLGINYDVKVEKLAYDAKIPLISMDSSEDFDLMFQNLKQLNPYDLKNFAESNYFDWGEIEKFLV